MVLTSSHSNFLFQRRGTDTLGLTEAIRVSEATTGDSANGRATQVALLRAMEGCFQIPRSIATSRVYVPSGKEVLYLQRISRYLVGTADMLTYPP